LPDLNAPRALVSGLLKPHQVSYSHHFIHISFIFGLGEALSVFVRQENRFNPFSPWSIPQIGDWFS